MPSHTYLGSIARTNPRVLTVGVFDGVHLGHQRVIQELLSYSKIENIPSEIITFTNHPSSILHPERVKPFITPLEQKIELLKLLQADVVSPIPFSLQFAELSAEEFLTPLNLKALVLGHDAKIGKGRSGDPEHLHHLSKKLGFTLTYLPPLIVEGSPISSTRIRIAIEEGKIDEVNKLLGREYSLVLMFRNGVALVDNRVIMTPPEGSWKATINGKQVVVTLSRSDNQTTIKLPAEVVVDEEKTVELFFHP